ncbi:flagellar basal body-associated protein FliL [Rheinheimera sp. UJ63]|uniref:flagellar basal body-associated protein FliL n=1 Tax=Rheinheimera sp. UJ63 TaxID=2910157 RepID=UPI001F2264B0|nr:flagellar basal body-associated protein FliL [Rheinheimera sp. UJ63]MCF4009103.1 flagellar basal body-associated protein FliL [Rheinheimera sp. UJ63]
MADNELEIVDQGAKKKKLMMLIALVVVLAGAGGGYFFFMGSDTPAASAEVTAEGGAAADGTPVVQGTALYVQLPRPFVFNVAGLSRDRLVQIRVQLMVRGSANQALALKNIPLIESALLATFSSANADELISATGKEELKNKALIDLQNAMLDVVGSVVIAEVLFTGFVMQ